MDDTEIKSFAADGAQTCSNSLKNVVVHKLNGGKSTGLKIIVAKRAITMPVLNQNLENTQTPSYLFISFVSSDKIHYYSNDETNLPQTARVFIHYAAAPNGKETWINPSVVLQEKGHGAGDVYNDKVTGIKVTVKSIASDKNSAVVDVDFCGGSACSSSPNGTPCISGTPFISVCKQTQCHAYKRTKCGRHIELVKGSNEPGLPTQFLGTCRKEPAVLVLLARARLLDGFVGTSLP